MRTATLYPCGGLEVRRCRESLFNCPLRRNVAEGSGIKRCLEFRTSEEAVEWLAPLGANPDQMLVLRRIVAEQYLPISRLSNHQVLRQVAATVAAGSLCLIVPEHLMREAPKHGDSAENPPVAPKPVRQAPAPATSRPAALIAPVFVPSGPPLSFYEVIVLDELGTGIAGVAVEITTPNGVQTATTDGSGSVRVDDVPPGMGSGHIVSATQLRAALRDRVEGEKRQSPPPQSDDLLVLSPVRACSSVSFPDARPQRIMIVSRTDLMWGSVVEHWGDLSLLSRATDPCRLIAHELTSILQLCSTGAGPTALLGLDPAGGADNAAAPDDPLGPTDSNSQLEIDIDALHEALCASDFDSVSKLITPAATPPPPPSPPLAFPVPSAEGVDFAIELASLALEGQVDLLVEPAVQV